MVAGGLSLFLSASSFGKETKEVQKAGQKTVSNKNEDPDEDSQYEEDDPPPHQKKDQDTNHGKTFTVQVGAYSKLRKAAAVRAILEAIGTAKVEKIHGEKDEVLYRVLIGTFATAQKAQDFINSHHIRDVFKGVWVNIIDLESPPQESGEELVPDSEVDNDPYSLQVNLYCEQNKRYGQYKWDLKPDPKNPNHDVDIKINWNCIPDPYDKWAAKDEYRNPSHIWIAPLFGIGSISANDSSAGSASRFDLAYGADIGAFKSFGGIGPTVEYRILNHSLSLNAGGSPSQSVLTHRALLGFRLPISHRFEFQPLFGFYTEYLYSGATGTFTDPLLLQAGARVTWHILELENRAWFNLIFGYHYLLPSTTNTFTVSSGSEWNVRLQSRAFFQDSGGIDWFLEYSSRAQSTPTLQQTDSLMLLGISALISL
jgi:hypothetical protein